MIVIELIRQGKSHNHHSHSHRHHCLLLFMIRIITGIPVIVEDVNAVVVELVPKEGISGKELANREGQNDDMELTGE